MNELNTKKTYQPPLLERVSIDNEMSLILVSFNPGDQNSYATYRSYIINSKLLLLPATAINLRLPRHIVFEFLLEYCSIPLKFVLLPTVYHPVQ